MTDERGFSSAAQLGQADSLEAGAERGEAREGSTGGTAARRRSERTVKASARTQLALDQAGALARSDAPVVIQGPEGSGRTHFAHILHEWSARASAPLVRFSATLTAEGLQARELFGASAAKDPLLAGGAHGALVDAGNGTLIVERIDRLSPALRSRLSQAVRDGQFTRDGSSEPTSVRARVIATSESGVHDPLPGLAVQTLDLAGLSERREDILPLAAQFLAEHAEEQGIEPVGFTVDARRWLVEEPWTGNARELRERVRGALRLSGDGALSAEALMLSSEGDEVPSFKDAKRAFETRYVEGLLRRCSGNISRAARLAKKDRKDFYDVIRRTGVDPTDFRS